jgi:hypothetical protein
VLEWQSVSVRKNNFPISRSKSEWASLADQWLLAPRMPRHVTCSAAPSRGARDLKQQPGPKPLRVHLDMDSGIGACTHE